MSNYRFNDLKDKVCVITGGAGVLGKAMCEALAVNGVKLAILDINLESATAVANEISSQYNTVAVGIEANVLEKVSLEAAAAQIKAELGAIDILINGAGGNSPAATSKLEMLDENNLDQLEDSFYGLSMDGFDKVFALNFKGTLLPSMVFTKDMLDKKDGVVINISSMNAYRPLTKIPAYSAAKASINNFTEWLSVHLARTGIRVNAIAPGFFLTNQNRFLLTDEKTGELTDRGHKIIANTPMGKFGKPEDLQGTLLFLLSEASAFITGITIPVDGGFNAYSGV
ncbi:SDR family oxidoreductase [Prolixibacteraceae bacterium JC049]|nr:SDR family oxidoreductase [Prolixibacteraceae bacterium JC049]